MQCCGSSTTHRGWGNRLAALMPRAIILAKVCKWDPKKVEATSAQVFSHQIAYVIKNSGPCAAKNPLMSNYRHNSFVEYRFCVVAKDKWRSIKRQIQISIYSLRQNLYRSATKNERFQSIKKSLHYTSGALRIAYWIHRNRRDFLPRSHILTGSYRRFRKKVSCPRFHTQPLMWLKTAGKVLW